MPVRKKTTSQLKELTVVAQCLDNQWIPPELASQLEGSIGFESLGEARKHLIRREFFGALLTSEQLILNRAYAYTNDVIGDICANQRDRDQLARLFDKEMMVLFFAGETSLEDDVKFQIGEHRLAGNQLKSLQSLFANSDVPCLRMSWDDEKFNKAALEMQLAKRFHNFVQTISSVSVDVLAEDLSLSSERRNAFAKRIHDLATFAHSFRSPDRPEGPSYVTRTEIYDEFVCFDKKSVGGFIDDNKPFARQIKSLVDLKYNCNLPDALARYAVTAEGDIDRTVLQEERELQLDSLAKFDNDDESALIDLLTRGAFDELNTFNSFDFLSRLTLGEVIALRETPSWSEYAELVKRVLPAKNQGKLSDHAIFRKGELESLSKAHTALLQNAARFLESRILIEQVSGWWEIGVSLVGTGVKVFSHLSDSPSIQIPRDAARTFATATAPILIEATFNTIDRAGRKRAIRKYPLLRKRVEGASEFFHRTRQKIEDYQRRHSEVSVTPATNAQLRADDRKNTLNLPES